MLYCCISGNASERAAARLLERGGCRQFPRPAGGSPASR
jgi:hypothetical protein